MNQKNTFRILIAICLLGNTLTTNAQQMKDGFVKIFDGKSMAGWEADTTFWKVKDNSFVGEVTPQTPIKTNTFLIYRESLPADFELKAKYRISVDGNSGINNTIPSTETYGKINVPQYYDNCQTCDRINPDILSAFKENPYTQSLSSY